MSKYYLDYVWKKGLPYGVQEDTSMQGLAYKIVSDPYHKRNSIEVYIQGVFQKVVYDSALFDFRELKLGEQISWQKTIISENEQEATSQIRNQDDRLILMEKYVFENRLCRSCKAYSPHGMLISEQKIFYTKLGDPFNAAILYDANEHPIMLKKYKLDEESEEFGELLEEIWDGKIILRIISQLAYST